MYEIARDLLVLVAIYRGRWEGAWKRRLHASIREETLLQEDSLNTAV